MTGTADPRRRSRMRPPSIDGDIHNDARPLGRDSDQYLPKRWRQPPSRRSAARGYDRHELPAGASPNAARTDAWPPNGGPPGSDLALPARAAAGRLGHRLRHPTSRCSAAGRSATPTTPRRWRGRQRVADRRVARPEPRLRASIVRPYEDGRARRRGDRAARRRPRFVQVLLASGRTSRWGGASTGRSTRPPPRTACRSASTSAARRPPDHRRRLALLLPRGPRRDGPGVPGPGRSASSARASSSSFPTLKSC